MSATVHRAIIVSSTSDDIEDAWEYALELGLSISQGLVRDAANGLRSFCVYPDGHTSEAGREIYQRKRNELMEWMLRKNEEHFNQLCWVEVEFGLIPDCNRVTFASSQQEQEHAHQD